MRGPGRRWGLWDAHPAPPPPRSLGRGRGRGLPDSWRRGEERKRYDVISGSHWLRLAVGPYDKMADISLDELIRKRGVTVKGR